MMTEVIGMHDGIIRVSLSRNDQAIELAYISEEMLEEGMAIRYYEFVADYQIKTVIAIRKCTDDVQAEYEVYWGDKLAPIQAYRIVRDLFELFNKLMVDDFVDVITTHLAKGGYATDDPDISVEAKDLLEKNVREFFETIRVLREKFNINF